MTTIQERVAAGRLMLEQAGIGTDEAALSARLLAQHLLGWDGAHYFTSASQSEPDGFAERYDALVARRTAREPTAYIIGRQEFWGLPFEVSDAVLIPRPETELIVEAALEQMPRGRDRVNMADVCTGSGCLAVSLAYERAEARVVATDISCTAIDVARRNAARHGVSGRVRFVRTNLLDGVEGGFDLIVANPPYVARRDQAALQPEVRDFEPAVALFGGDDGVEMVTTLVRQAASRLRPGGSLIFEFGCGRDAEVEELVGTTSGLELLGLHRDLRGIARTAVVRRDV
jgi:release factor glutamine methyltransferase